MRFVYCYRMEEDPERVREVAPRHAAYWHQLGLPEYVGGPFEDRSGGLILFDAPAREHAAELVSEDPFQGAGVITDWWLKVWIPE